jgi:uncharacterized protein YbjT (DUF2867 family)
MSGTTIALAGGTGFVGRHLGAALLAAGYRVRQLHRETGRRPGVDPAYDSVAVDFESEEELADALRGAEALINLVGILHQTRHETFQSIHVNLPERLVGACAAAGVGRYLHMSALNADATEGPSQYLFSKGEGEDRVHALARDDLKITSFRPSIIFGEGDNFFGQFAQMLRFAPVFPLVCPEARFSPVFVEDVAGAFLYGLTHEETAGERYDLCGPDEYSFRELLELLAQCMGRRRWIVGLPDALSKLQAHILQHLPGRLFTVDNYLSLTRDSVCQESGLIRLGVQPHALASVLPQLVASKRGAS